MTKKKAEIVAVTASVIISVLPWIITINSTIQKYGKSYLDADMAILIILEVACSTCGIYLFLYWFWIQNLKDKENGTKKGK